MKQPPFLSNSPSQFTGGSTWRLNLSKTAAPHLDRTSAAAIRWPSPKPYNPINLNSAPLKPINQNKKHFGGFCALELGVPNPKALQNPCRNPKLIAQNLRPKSF